MSETLTRRRSRGKTTHFDNARERLIISVLIGLGIIVVLLAVAVVISLYLPDVALTMQLGGAGRSKDVLPRNTDIWIIDAEGGLRFVTLVFPAKDETGVSDVTFPVAGPYVSQAGDIAEAKTIGALTSSSEMMPGTDSDSSHVYEQFWLERDPASEVYGLDILTTNSPYITALNSEDPEAKTLSMGASKQEYYAQVVVAIAFAPGTKIDSIVQTQTASGQATPVPESFLRPYRRINLNGWLIYYYDTTSLTSDQTIRIQYRSGKGSSNLDIYEVDARR